MTVSVKEARGKLKALIDRANAGEEITIMRRGKQVARLVPPLGPSAPRKPFPAKELESFRATIKLKGEPASQTIIRMRSEERS